MSHPASISFPFVHRGPGLHLLCTLAAGIVLPLLLAHDVHADAQVGPEETADAFVARGIKRTESQEWDAAIALFRAAERVYPRAIHDCNIGLAYARSDRPHLAWYYLGRCSSRSTGNLPAWVDTRRKEATDTLSAGAYAALDFTVTPGGRVSLSVFSMPGEVFTPTLTNPGAPGSLTLWLPFGTHTVTFDAGGCVSEVRTLEVDAALKARKPRERVQVALVEVAKPEAPIPGPVPGTFIPPPAGPTATTILGWSLVGAGGTMATVAGALWLFKALPLSGVVRTEPLSPEQKQEFDRYNVPTSVAFGVGLAAAGAGIWVLLAEDDAPAQSAGLPATVAPGRPPVMRVGLDPLPGGGLLSARGAF